VLHSPLIVSQDAHNDDAPEPARIINATPFAWRNPASIPPRLWIYGSSLLRGSLSLIVAPGASGKTAFTAGMALSLASGRALLGKPVYGGPKRVWLWNLEDSRDELDRLIMASALHWRMSPADIADRLYVDSGLSGDGLIIANEGRDGFALNDDTINALAAELTARAIDVLIVDPFVSSHRVSENDNGTIDAIAKAWARLAVEASCAILIVHHSRKLSGAENTADAARGASALVNAARSVLTINRMGEDEAAKFGVEGDERRRFFRVYDDKNNRAPPADSSDWYKLESQVLGNGPNGGDGDSLPVVIPWTPPSDWEGITTDSLRQVQAAIHTGEWRKDVRTGEAWAGHAVASVLGLDAQAKPVKARIGRLLAEWINNGALIVEQRNDARRHIKDFIGVGNWVDDTSAPVAPVAQKLTGALAQKSAPLVVPPLGGLTGANVAGNVADKEEILPTGVNPESKTPLADWQSAFAEFDTNGSGVSNA
jgi:hypothetical protein